MVSRPISPSRLMSLLTILRSRMAYIPSPPSTSSTSPVTNEASSEQRKRTAPATSSGVPSRASGVFARIACCSLLREDVGERGLDIARGDRVCTDAARGELPRERLREADDARLRGRVVRLAGVAVDADDAGQVDDRARPGGASSLAQPPGRCGTRRQDSCRSPFASPRPTFGRSGRLESDPRC